MSTSNSIANSNTISITVKYGTGNSLTRNFDIPVTVGEILGDDSVAAALGFGDNVEGFINSVPQPESVTLRNGDVLSIHDKACAKAADGMVSVTIKYGTGNSLTRNFDIPVTVGEILGDDSIAAALGFGDNVEGFINSVPQPDEVTLRDGDVLSVHDKACAKAADGQTTLTVKYGTGNSLSRSFGHPITVGEILADRGIQSALGFGSNVEGFLNSVPQPNTVTLRDGDVLSVHDKACAKAIIG